MLVVFLGFFVFLLFLLSLVVSVRFKRDTVILKTLPAIAMAFSSLAIPSGASAQSALPQSATSQSTSPQSDSQQSAPYQPATPPSALPPSATPDQSTPAASPANESQETAGTPAQSAESAYERPVSWRSLFHNWVDDQKQIWTFPARLTQDRNWIPTAAVLGTTAGLFFADPHVAGYFRTTPEFHGFNHIFNGNAMGIGMGVTSASLYAIGRIRKDSKMQRTALLAGEAMADAAMVQTVLKDATMRLRPVRYPDTGWFAASSSPTAYIRGNGSFPSGHSIEAFSVATIVARRYGNHRWVPYVAYGLASLVGFSRLTLNVHFLSDVFMGAAMGYSISRFTVLRQ
jgi:membrane-associated phospholipid phosphatase